MIRFFLSVMLLVMIVSAVAHKAAAETTSEKVRRTHVLRCGIDQSEAEYSTTDEHGPRVEFDQDLCKAVAVAVAGPNAQVIIKGYPDDETSMAALISGEVDIIPSLSNDFSHSTNSRISYSRPVFWDGVSVMVSKNTGIHSTGELSGKKICFIAETEVELALHAWFEDHHLDLLPFPFQEQGEMEAAYSTKNCTGIAADQTRLAETRSRFSEHAADYIVLPEVLARDSMAMAYRASEPEWGKILDWVFNALVQAEESGITAENINAKMASNDPTITRLLGKTYEVGHPLGLKEDWAVNTIKAVGNYGQIFARDLGAGSQSNLTRGQNELWNKGGLIYTLPLK